MRRYQIPEYVIPVKRDWRRIRDDEIEILKRSDPKRYDFIDNYIYEYQINPLAFALAHGRKRGDGWNNDGIAFINDWKSDWHILIGPNQCLRWDTKVITPDGYKLIKDLRVGDMVIGRKGKPTQVKAVFNNGLKQMYKMGFAGRNGYTEDYAYASRDHLWWYKSSRENKWQVVDTFKLLYDLHSGIIGYIPDFREGKRIVTSYTPSTLAECWCIQVDNNDNTYVIEGNIVTHNCGKSFSAALKSAFYICPTERSWICHQQHMIKYHPWRGPKICVIASYSWENVGIVWEAYKKVLPRRELGPYAPNWGAFEDETGAPKKLSLAGNNPNKEIELACGSRLVFLNYGQGMEHWEGRQCDCAHLDEQCPENLFDALTARMRTRGGKTGYTPIWSSLTPHVVEGRPDTGAAGFIVNKIMSGKTTKGRACKFFYLTVDSTPDAIYSKVQKKQAYKQYILEPEAANDDRAIRHGRSRYYGEPEVGGGLVIANFNPNIHIIDNYDLTKWKPTYYRMIDHGLNPCAALIIAVMPNGDWVVDKEYYEYGKAISTNSRGIVETLSGNSVRKIDDVSSGELTYPIYEEVSSNVEFYASELDNRSFGTKSNESERTIGILYNDYGLRCTPSSGTHRELTLPMLLDKFNLDRSRKHISLLWEKKVPEEVDRFGSPKIYIKRRCPNLINEIQNWIYNERNKPVDKDDHLISCTLFMVSRDRPYMGDYTDICKKEADDTSEYIPLNNITGY